MIHDLMSRTWCKFDIMKSDMETDFGWSVSFSSWNLLFRCSSVIQSFDLIFKCLNDIKLRWHGIFDISQTICDVWTPALFLSLKPLLIFTTHFVSDRYAVYFIRAIFWFRTAKPSLFLYSLFTASLVRSLDRISDVGEFLFYRPWNICRREFYKSDLMSDGKSD